MKEIILSGHIGWDVTTNDLQEKLVEAAGAPIDVRISSAGGIVSVGLEMFNLLRNYPGETTVTATGYIMSIASYLLMAADKGKRRAEANAILMIHNSGGGVCGDHNEVLTYGGFLQRISIMILKSYAKNTNLSEEELSEMMDKTEFFFGEEMLEAGFINEILDVDDDQDLDKDAATAVASMAFQECSNKLAANVQAAKEDMAKAAQMCADLPDGSTNNPRAHKTGPVNSGGSDMDRETLERKHPELLKEIIATAQAGMETKIDEAKKEGLTVGATNEQQRIADVKAVFLPGHEKLIDELVADGKTTGAEASLKIITAENALREAAAGNIDGEANGAVGGAEPPSKKKPATNDGPVTDESLKAEWDADAKLQSEFMDFEAYASYRKADVDGLVKVKG